MAVYKVIQDVEAEDKILGPLTLKSFVYALIAGGLAFVCVRLAISGSLGDAKWAVIILLLPPIMVFGLLAAPIGKDQPNEVWILSHVRFFMQSRKRVWDQTGMSELVTITAPRKIEKVLTKNFSQDEVHSRLKALATTLDSRGWAVKNVTTDIYGQSGYFLGGGADSDRLIGASSVAQSQPVLDIHASDDILDEQTNETAQNFSQLMEEADSKRKQALQSLVNSPPANDTVDYRFLDEHSAMTPGVGGSTFIGTNLTTPAEQADGDEPKAKSQITLNPQPSTLPSELGDPSLRDRHPHFETKPSLAEQRKQASSAEVTLAEQQKLTQQSIDQQAKAQDKTNQSSVTAVSQTVKMDLSRSDDISVASVAQLANHHETVRQIGPNEVEISLH